MVENLSFSQRTFNFVSAYAIFIFIDCFLLARSYIPCIQYFLQYHVTCYKYAKDLLNLNDSIRRNRSNHGATESINEGRTTITVTVTITIIENPPDSYF